MSQEQQRKNADKDARQTLRHKTTRLTVAMEYVTSELVEQTDGCDVAPARGHGDTANFRVRCAVQVYTWYFNIYRVHHLRE